MDSHGGVRRSFGGGGILRQELREKSVDTSCIALDPTRSIPSFVKTKVYDPACGTPRPLRCHGICGPEFHGSLDGLRKDDSAHFGGT